MNTSKDAPRKSTANVKYRVHRADREEIAHSFLEETANAKAGFLVLGLVLFFANAVVCSLHGD